MATTARTAERLARLLGPGARPRPMMGEYVLYWRDRVVGGLYDERLLLKDVAAVREAAPDAPLEEPYPGARPLRRLVQREIGDRLARMLLAGEVLDGQKVVVDKVDGTDGLTLRAEGEAHLPSASSAASPA